MSHDSFIMRHSAWQHICYPKYYWFSFSSYYWMLFPCKYASNLNCQNGYIDVGDKKMSPTSIINIVVVAEIAQLECFARLKIKRKKIILVCWSFILWLSADMTRRDYYAYSRLMDSQFVRNFEKSKNKFYQKSLEFEKISNFDSEDESEWDEMPR